jgi:hypothetical protein
MAENELDAILKATGEMFNSFDSVDRLFFRFVFFRWKEVHGPDGFINVATLIRALPELIFNAQRIRARTPKRQIRKMMRRLTLSAFVGDLNERYPNPQFLRRFSISFQALTFRLRQFVSELMAAVSFKTF